MTDDSEFLRRIYLDLTGRIPTYEQAQAFLADSRANKRAQLIESLLASAAYADQFSYYFLRRFQVTRNNLLSLVGRKNFQAYLWDFVNRDLPYDAVAREILTAAGDSDSAPAAGPLVRQVMDYFTTPVQDHWDAFTDMATTQFLGFVSQCISCHNGRGHLEKINLYLSPRRRTDFWQLSAFFARLKLQVISDDNAFYRPRLVFLDMPSGLYTGQVNPAYPGARPPRTGAQATPVYWVDGSNAVPQSDAWRPEFARMLTADRQFARAAVNYLWAYFFNSGIVDPPNGWDLARVDPANPPPDPWPLQNTNPALLEALTDRFIQSGYSIRQMVRLMTNSAAYQLSSRYPYPGWQDAYKAYFIRYDAHRLTAEQLFDSFVTATGTEPYMAVRGTNQMARYANQLPDPTEPVTPVADLLRALGRGDWLNVAPSNAVNLSVVLALMNGSETAPRTRSWQDQYTPQSRLSTWVAQGLSDAEIVQRIFLASLTRLPTAQELSVITAAKGGNRLYWLMEVQWAVLQKSDFVFQH